MLCSINSKAHLAILPSASRLWITSLSGYFETTMIGCVLN
jgi:hypothetical protein